MLRVHHSPRLIIRAYDVEDAAELYAAIEESRDHLRPWEAFADWFQTVDETAAWIQRRQIEWEHGATFANGLWSKATGQFLGGIELFPKSQQGEAPVYMLAYWIRQSAQGKGYVSEAVRTLSDYTLTHLRASRLYLEIDARNQRSIAVAERVGYRYDPLASAASIHEIYALTPSKPDPETDSMQRHE